MPENLKKLKPQAQMTRRGPFTTEVPGAQKVEGETIPRRNNAAKDGLQALPSIPGVETLYDLLRYSAAKYGNAKAVGARRIVNIHEETKKVKKMVDGAEQEVDKKWSYFELSPYTYKSFVEFEKMSLSVGSALKSLGLEPKDRMHLFAGTSMQWLSSAHGAMSQSLAIVTAYDTLGEEGLRHSMLQTKAKIMFTDPELLPRLVNPFKDAKDIQTVIYSTKNDPKQKDIDALTSAHPHLRVISFDELIRMGEENPAEPIPPKADDLACIMYTSGSTGTPKGVMIEHRNVIAAIAGVDVIVGKYLGPGDVLIAYLPAAHILEFVFENATIYWGGTLGYGTIRTLSDTSVRNCAGDIRELKPTVMVGVPQVWETVKKGIIGKVEAGGAVTSNLFWGAFAAKGFLLNSGLPGSGLIDSIVFNKVKEATGGKLRICLNGGGPISKETQRFISIAITPMIGGYGLTETCAMGAVMDPRAWTENALGEIPASVEIKLVDFADAGYFSTSNPPQGEIWIRGGAVVSGYLDMPEETAEAFTEDGWFKTGDIGEFDSDGHLRIIDRKKNLVKTMAGEYIALEKLESVYRSASIVANICVYAAEDRQKPIAIIVPAEPALKKLAADAGVKGSGLEDLVQDKKVNSAVLKQLQTAGQKSGLAGFEIIEGVVLADEEWTPQNGLTTAAQKLNRKDILKKYQKDVDRAYGRS
ncbi:long-chain-fatty-acid-CoA ligase 1 [Dothidotthia symphoricarpi CBS 119687]|uniref:Long-chain-fatty-acid-CoA ligase 1 n=1 Tax=Dothidotthia symphoricarpi CBS 119687 TaxID=1392245 RepID=A0A6A5ZZA4_9PLEO|nr:long-chain-fatty-acid-CoA ligase 1 [Dothidotthia symphoricarpi CBS 119687]KAF2125072.1 long-chain-fatty-acid-CoA ligase 1 [Dothidotthia symphoricarpi CBS 119687]